MDRITIKHLRARCAELNRLAGNPEQVWTSHDVLRPDGTTYTQNRAHIGSYVLDCAYGGYRVCRIVNESGGEATVAPSGYASARECLTALDALVYATRNAKEAV